VYYSIIIQGRKEKVSTVDSIDNLKEKGRKKGSVKKTKACRKVKKILLKKKN
jgi:hypothetical protein